MEDRMQQLERALQSVTATLTAANAREHNLTVEVQRLGAAPAPVDGQPSVRQTKVDTRTLGKPHMFTGEEQKWQDWKTVVSAYCSVVDQQMGVVMEAIATGASTNLSNIGLIASETMMSSQLFYILVMIMRGQPLTMVTNVGTSEGFLAWEKLIEFYEPTVRTKQAGQLLGILSWDFSGDLQHKIEQFDRTVSLYQARSLEVISDSMKIGIALRQMEEGSLRQHLLMNSSRLTTWKTFKSEIVDIKRASAAVGAVPMDIGALGKGKGKGGRGDDKKCGNCGRAGHFKKDCWAPGGGLCHRRR